MINKETKIFLSASSRPGNFGSTVYNHLFKEYGINAIYFPRKIDSADALIKAIKTLNLDGCSVSMPLKEGVMEFLNDFDSISASVSSVNTILNKDGILYGYNTDFTGLSKIFTITNPRNVLIYGSGALARTAIYALKKLSCPNITVTARRTDILGAISKRYDVNFVTAESASKAKFDLLMNATPVSTDSNSKLILSLINSSDTIVDAVVSPIPTILIKEARLRGKNIIDGIELCKYQLQEQFKIYTNVLPTIEMIDRIINKYYL